MNTLALRAGAIVAGMVKEMGITAIIAIIQVAA
jgi:hypothetical protein